MLTPAFELTQNEDFLIISVQVPYAKISEVEVHFEENDFMFYSKPYYLRLNLPGKVLHCEEPDIKYDFDKRTFTIFAPKHQKGETFEGLDLVTFLLAPKKGKTASTPLIEVLESSCVEEVNEEIDWNIEQLPSEDQFGNLILGGQQCGFANSYSYSIFNLKEEAAEIFDAVDPQNKSLGVRRQERLATENARFDEDHYIADLYQDEEIQQLIKYQPEWERLYEEMLNNPSISVDEKTHFTQSEKECLRKLPNKEYILDKDQARTAFLGLVDILFAYAYNKRTTEGENTVESAWTVNKLSVTLSWLEVFTSVPEVAVACIRRSLIFPLFRHFELSVTVLEDTRKILMLGRKYIIKCLLEIREMFSQSEPRYILNDLFITDYIVWMQTKMCSSNKLVPLAQAIEKVLLTKGDMGLNLVDIETFAKVAWMSQDTLFLDSKSDDKSPSTSKDNCDTESNNLCNRLGKLSLDTKSNKNALIPQDSESSCSENDSDYDICSSCVSGSSNSSSSTYETESELDSDDSSSSDTDSDEDSESSHSDDSISRLL